MRTCILALLLASGPLACSAFLPAAPASIGSGSTLLRGSVTARGRAAASSTLTLTKMQFGGLSIPNFGGGGGGSGPKVIAVTGSTGLVGKQLVKALEADGKTVLPIKRSGGKFAITSEELEGAEAVIHLAGENIATGSLPLGIQAWTGGKKDEIMRSRVEGTAQIVSTINACKSPPKVLVCASAVGLYGYDSGDAEFSEASPRGNGFLAEVVDKWEQESSKAKCRVVNARFGVVLSKQAGALAKLLPIFQLGGGGILGDGKQYFPFVSERDAVSAVKFLATSGNAKGPYNIAAPVPATNADFTSAMGSALSRPTILPFPGFAAKALFGQMGEEVLLGGQKVSSSKLTSAGFKFQDQDILSGVKSALGK